MQKITLYCYARPSGGMSVSPVKLTGNYTERYRLIADEGHVLTDGVNYTSCTDTDNPDLWTEVIGVENPEEMTETEEKAIAYDILMGVSE